MFSSVRGSDPLFGNEIGSSHTIFCFQKRGAQLMNQHNSCFIDEAIIDLAILCNIPILPAFSVESTVYYALLSQG